MEGKKSRSLPVGSERSLCPAHEQLSQPFGCFGDSRHHQGIARRRHVSGSCARESRAERCWPRRLAWLVCSGSAAARCFPAFARAEWSYAKVYMERFDQLRAGQRAGQTGHRHFAKRRALSPVALHRRWSHQPEEGLLARRRGSRLLRDRQGLRAPPGPVRDRRARRARGAVA